MIRNNRRRPMEPFVVRIAILTSANLAIGQVANGTICVPTAWELTLVSVERADEDSGAGEGSDTVGVEEEARWAASAELYESSDYFRLDRAYYEDGWIIFADESE